MLVSAAIYEEGWGQAEVGIRGTIAAAAATTRSLVLASVQRSPHFHLSCFLDAVSGSSESTVPVAGSATQQPPEGCRTDLIVPGSVWQQKDAKGTPWSHVVSES